MGLWGKLYEKHEADPERSLRGCLVANVLLIVIIGVLAWLLGATLHMGS